MRTIEIQMPEPIYQQAQELAFRENIPMDQVVSLAVTQAVTSWANESQVELQRREADRTRFLDALSGALLAESAD
jgi:hypothetical protein